MRVKTLRVLWCAFAVCAIVFVTGCSHKDDTDAADANAAPSKANSGDLQQVKAKPKTLDIK